MASANYKSDKDLREALTRFFDAAATDVVTDYAALTVGIGDAGFRLRDGVMFIEKPATTEARKAVVKRCNKLLGPVDSHEQDIDDLLWGLAAARAQGTGAASIEEVVKSVITKIEEDLSRDFVFIDNNYVVVLESPVSSMDIGPVSVMTNENIATYVGEKQPGAKWKITEGQPSYTVNADGALEVSLSHNTWRVSLKAADKNVKEQAAWLIDVALSYLRLSHEEAGPFFPRIGDVEAHPLMPDRGGETSVTIVGTKVSVGGHQIPSHYRVGEHLRNKTVTLEFKRFAAEIFDAKKSSVAERFGQGLGWMTRGRRAKDRAERLLFFFTAIEALLSSDDKTAPVTQTIARHASVILADNPEHRENIANQIKGLYAARSALVHAGKRNVSSSDANTVQYLTEALYSRVMSCVDLKSDFQKLNEALAKASYGSVWP